MILSRHSHQKVKVYCDLKAVKNCKKFVITEYRGVQNNRERNNGKYICLNCSRYIKFSGRNNPNCKYIFDDNYFENIDSAIKAYILGWIASDGSINKSGFIISILDIDISVLNFIRDNICKDIPIKNKKNNCIYLCVNSQKISKDLCKILQINPGKKSHTIKFPDIKNKYKKYFLLGYFEGDGTINNPNNYHKYPRCSISSCSKKMLESIDNYLDIPSSITCNSIQYCGKHAIEFLDFIYSNLEFEPMYRKYNLYKFWKENWIRYKRGKYLPHYNK